MKKAHSSKPYVVSADDGSIRIIDAEHTALSVVIPQRHAREVAAEIIKRVEGK